MFQRGCYLVLRGVKGCFSLHIAIRLCCRCVHLYNREAIGVGSVPMTCPMGWQHWSKVNHLTVTAPWKCVLLDVICWNGSRALGTWIPWRLCVTTTCMLQFASNNTYPEIPSHNTRLNLQRNYHSFWTIRHATSWKYCMGQRGLQYFFLTFSLYNILACLIVWKVWYVQKHFKPIFYFAGCDLKRSLRFQWRILTVFYIQEFLSVSDIFIISFV